jgi:hypothetical protein
MKAKEDAMRCSRIVRSLLLPFGALALAVGLAGCVVAPAYPGYGYAPQYVYTPAPVVTFGGGWGGGGWGGRGWHRW